MRRVRSDKHEAGKLTGPGNVGPSKAVDGEPTAMLRRLAEMYGADTALPSVRDLAVRLGVDAGDLDIVESGRKDAAAAVGVDAAEAVPGLQLPGRVDGVVGHRTVPIVVDPSLIEHSGASPVWGQVWGMLLGEAERRSASTGESFPMHMTSRLRQPGPIRDRFEADLRRGAVGAVLSIGMPYELVQFVNKYRVPVVGFAGTGNHVVASIMHEQIAKVTHFLADAGCRRVELWTRAGASSPVAFSPYDIVDPPALIRRLRDPYDRPAQRIGSRATADTARSLAAFREDEPVTLSLCHRLADILNVAEFHASLWDERVFDQVKLRPETVKAIDDRAAGGESILWANRKLIQDTFAKEVAQTEVSEPDNVNAFRAALRSRVPSPDTAVVRHAGRGDGVDVGNQLPGYNLARSVFASVDAPKPDGIVIDDDMIASGVHKALEELGVRVGVDVQLAVHANAGSAVGFALHGRVIQMMFDPADYVAGMFSLLDHATVGDLDRMNFVRVSPRVLMPGR